MGERYSGESPFQRVRRVVLGTAPAAAADWSITVPMGKLWHVTSIVASLTTSVTAATRSVGLLVSDGHDNFVSAGPAGTQIASLTDTYNWFEGAGGFGFGNWITQPIPHLTIPAGYTISSSTTAIQAGDQWTKPVLWVVETVIRWGDINIGDWPESMVEVFVAPSS